MESMVNDDIEDLHALPIEVLRSSAAFLDAADRLHQLIRDRGGAGTFVDTMPIYFLYGQSIELALKAYLRARGFSTRRLNADYGHDLLSLYEECTKHLLFTSAHCRSIIGIIAAQFGDVDWHTRFSYVSDITTELPTLDVISVSSHALVDAVQPVCEGMDPLRAALIAVRQTQMREVGSFSDCPPYRGQKETAR